MKKPLALSVASCLAFLLAGAYFGRGAETTPAGSGAGSARRLTLACEPDLVKWKSLIPSLDHLPPDTRRFTRLEFTRTPQGPVYLDLYLRRVQPGLCR